MAGSAAAGVWRFAPPLREGVIRSRPNRFIMMVDVGGRLERCHCPVRRLSLTESVQVLVAFAL